MRTAPLGPMLLLAACAGTPTAPPEAARDARAEMSDAAVGAFDAPEVGVDVAGDDDVPTDRVRVVPTTWRRAPPPLPTYSHARCPTLRGGVDLATSLNEGFPSGPHTRRFRLVVPRGYDPAGTDRWPVLFAWHWLAGSSEMLREGEIPQSAEQARMIVVVPDQRTENGQPVDPFVWPFITPAMAEDDLRFTDDLLACVSSQFRIDPARVHALGVSAGALWLTHLLTTPAPDTSRRWRCCRGHRDLSPGLRDALEHPRGPLSAIVLGRRARPRRDRLPRRVAAPARLLLEGHFVVSCTTTTAGTPSAQHHPAPGETRFAFIWQFFAAHPYGMAPATSPWLTAGLPSSAPSWCEIPAVLRP
ncbi:MAG: hypothetical protein U0325_11810 [Polyangiales bacterium]